jgi:hypothetical protein
MKHTKLQVQMRAYQIRVRYAEGKLTSTEIAQYESLPGWRWDVSKIYVSFSEARALARKQNFKTLKEFDAWKKPEGMPSHPHTMYANSGWFGYGDFLGTGNVREKVFMSFTKARALARKQSFNNVRGFLAWNKPRDVPSNPDKSYADSGWTNWYDFLGIKKGGNHD